MRALVLDIDDLFLNENQRVKNYFVDTITHTHVNDHLTENRISSRVQKEYVKKDSSGHLLKLEVLSRKQSNLTGMLAVEDFLSVLFEKLLIYADDYGKIKSIINLKEIKEDWYDKRSDFKKEFKYEIDKIDNFLDALDIVLENQKDFIQIIDKSDIGTLLFPPIYNQRVFHNSNISCNKVFDNFFGNNDLPMKISSQVVAQNEITNGFQIGRSGDIDYIHINSNEIKDFFRKNYNDQSLSVDLDLTYLETLDLDNVNDIDTATLMMGVEIKDIYEFRQVSKTQKI